MSVVPRFARQIGLWTLALSAFLAVTGWGGHESAWSLTARLPGILGFALILAHFPAAVAVGVETLARRSTVLRRLVGVLLAALALTVVVVALNQVVGPRALAAGRTAPGGVVEVRELTWSQLRGHGREAAAAVRDVEPGTGDLSAWRLVNVAAFEHDRRLAHALLPLLLTWIGLCVGYWLDRAPQAQARLPLALSVAFGLLASIYFGGENGFEMVAVRVVGPAAFAAWFIPLAPAVLACGLGLPTLVSVWSANDPGGP